jgi:hypothetical protein
MLERFAVAALAVLVAACHRIEAPTAPTAGPFTETFASQLGVRGAAARSFTVNEPGTIDVTLTSIGPPASVEVGLGVGIPNSTGNGCNLTRSVVTTASGSPQITVAADSGAYCVRVFDVGNLTGDVSFSISVLHP